MLGSRWLEHPWHVSRFPEGAPCLPSTQKHPPCPNSWLRPSEAASGFLAAPLHFQTPDPQASKPGKCSGTHNLCSARSVALTSSLHPPQSSTSSWCSPWRQWSMLSVMCQWNGHHLLARLNHIWVVLPRTGKMSNICHNFFFFGALLWPNGLIFWSFVNCSEEILSVTV